MQGQLIDVLSLPKISESSHRLRQLPHGVQRFDLTIHFKQQGPNQIQC